MNYCNFYEGIYPEGNTSEREVGEQLRKFSQPWVIFHGVNMESPIAAEYNQINRGELDFVLIHPRYGLITVEVKGEGYAVEGTKWTFKGEKKESPYMQLWRNTKILIEILEKEGYRKNKILYRSYVFWPYVGRDSKKGQGLGPESHDMNTLYKEDINYDNPKELAEKLITGFDKDSAPFEKGFTENIREILAPYQEGVQLVSKLGIISQVLEHATKQQIEAFKGITDPEKKSLKIFGPPGSGKTILAKEMAREAALNDKKVLFLCYNTLFGETLKEEFKKEKNIEVGLVLTFFSNLGVDLGNNREEALERDEKIAKELNDLVTSAEEKHKFDVLIIDEAQDFSPQWWNFFELLVELNDAKWAVFYDARQTITHKDWSPPEFRNPETQYPLNMIVRSTREISEKVMNVYEENVYLSNDGIAPEYHELVEKDSPGRLEEARNIVSRAVYGYINVDGFHRNQITVLVPSGKYIKEFNTAPYGENDILGTGSRVHVNSIYKFKGMESEIVILAAIDKFHLQDGFYTESTKALLYSGMGRAKSHLVVVGDKEVKKLINWDK